MIFTELLSYRHTVKLLIDRDIKRKELCVMAGISSATLAKMSKGESVTTDSLLKICVILHCDISDIMEITEELPTERGHEKK